MLTLAERPLKIEVVVDPARATMAAPAQPQKQNPSGAGKSARAAKRHAKAKRRKEARPTKTLEDLDAEMEGVCDGNTYSYTDYSKQASSDVQPMQDGAAPAS